MKLFEKGYHFWNFWKDASPQKVFVVLNPATSNCCKVFCADLDSKLAVKTFCHCQCFCTTCEALYTTVRMAPQAAGFCRSERIDFLLAQKYELLQRNSRLLGCERVMETRAEFHFSCVYTFSATLSSLRNWAKQR